MRLLSLLLMATLVAVPAWPQQATPSSPQDRHPATTDPQKQTKDPQPPPTSDEDGAANGEQPQSTDQLDLPVSLDKIKEGLAQKPTLSMRTLDEKPTFRVQILERQKIEELLATLNYKAGPTPAGGVYWDEVQRQMWPSVDNPLRQPYAAFSQGELLTVLIENLAGKMLAGKAANAITNADRSRAEAAAREEVQRAIRDYCGAQPNGGTNIQICNTSSAYR